MPHQVIEYSVNLESVVDIDALITAMHDAAAAIDALPVGGLRTRAVARAHYRIADGHPDNLFVNATLRIASGRSLDVRKAAGEALFKRLCDFLSPVYENHPLAISYEVQEIDPDTRWKQNNLRDYLARRQQGD